MPEGHSIHRLARRHRRLLVGRRVRASSPQGRFAEGAALIDGATVVGTDAWGKHLFHTYADHPGGEPLVLHVHLGLYGKFREGRGEPDEPRGALRLRLVVDGPDERSWLDLRGPTACEIVTAPERDLILDRLGPDPLRSGTDLRAWMPRLARSRAPIGTLLLDQSAVAGIGNVYRAELLFRHGVDPHLPGREVDPGVLDAMWLDLVRLMRAGVRSGRIVTTEPEHRERPAGRVRRIDAHYVYGRVGRPCRVCGTAVLDGQLAARRLFWCPVCQPPGGGR
ncbi:Fpg/Nei family DNA glycosylase [Nocardioides currus]|uniref:DNA-(apurinic or apyrimidinic site) lyase n=1 Tax=Nocardioides currus TaxID=2133958 RepID=A0A2R7YU56_9ACTN|nr:DNA-formamidopyrimidine glycosylase family protein [Nocardioides currus]PUA79616.1 DNA glycosylase [Nocardioides currus]